MHVIMFHCNRKLRCMTLIELMTALSITLLLLAISIPIFIKQAKTTNIESSSRVVEEFINRARNFAFNPNQEFPQKYNVTFSAGKDGKSLNAIIQGYYRPITAAGNETSVENVDQINIPGIISQNGYPVSIDFEPITGRLIDTSVGLPIVLKAFSSNDTKTISINSLGNVEVGQ